LESWAFADRALFHRALINMEARYRVWGSSIELHTESQL
jgi:hypothetical protein